MSKFSYNVDTGVFWDEQSDIISELKEHIISGQ